MEMRTFGELKKAVLKKAGTPNNFFAFRLISGNHNSFWDEMNEEEYRRGYVRGEYEKPGSPALCEMRLLTQKEFDDYIKRFKSFHRK